MKDLNELALEYRKTENPELLNELFRQLEKVIHKKATYVYYQQTIKAKKKYFKLVDNKLTTFDDVKQELYLEVLRQINIYDIKKPFLTYFYACLWKWKPAFIDKEFFRQMDTYKESELASQDNPSPLVNIAKFYEVDYEILYNNIGTSDFLTEEEKQIIDLIFINPDLKQKDVAKMLNKSEARISQIIKDIKEKIKNF